MTPKKEKLKLIQIYMYICDLCDKELKYYCQRGSNDSNPAVASKVMAKNKDCEYWNLKFPAHIVRTGVYK